MYQTENVWAGGTYVTAVLLGGVMVRLACTAHFTSQDCATVCADV